MNKPTVFFSHSSNDKKAVLAVKNKLDKATGGAVEIFMSSDGQSIPFGSNWIHKIEEGLEQATIMFVFVTENSISSGWIYFEAGYAYSKGIQVIPVGIGIDIGALKAPLNLLQGFNIISEDSLNNFITIINKTFSYHFECVFEENDYLDVVSNVSPALLHIIKFEEMVEKAECDFYRKQRVNDEIREYDIEKFFNDIVSFLENNNIQYSINDLAINRVGLVTGGVKIIYTKDIDANKEKCNNSKISFSVSPYYFHKSFSLLKSLLQLQEDKESGYIRLHLKRGFNYVTTEEDGSSILSNHSEFELDKAHIGGYICSKYGLRFYIFDCNGHAQNRQPDYVASVVFDNASVEAEDVINLMNKLYDVGFIIAK